MATKYLDGDSFLLKLSPDGGTSTYTLVCLSKQGLSRSRSKNVQNTQCGASKAFGPVDATIPVEAVNNLTPAALVSGVGEASYKLVAAWFTAKTTLLITRKTPSDGSELFFQANAVISKLDDTEAVGSNMTFSLELDIDASTIDETP